MDYPISLDIAVSMIEEHLEYEKNSELMFLLKRINAVKEVASALFLEIHIRSLMDYRDRIVNVCKSLVDLNDEYQYLEKCVGSSETHHGIISDEARIAIREFQHLKNIKQKINITDYADRLEKLNDDIFKRLIKAEGDLSWLIPLHHVLSEEYMPLLEYRSRKVK